MAFDDRPTDVVTRLVGVYDADSTLRGELAYWVGARLGRAHCALCDITHGTFRERPEWNECRTTLAVPFETYHRNDQPARIRSATNGAAPVVVAETDERVVVLLDADALDACRGTVDLFVRALDEACIAQGLAWPTA